jgi:hypothetical protein
MSTATGSASRSSDQTFLTANASLPLSPPASPAVTPVPETPKLEPLSEDGLMSDGNSAHEDDSLEVGDETLFGSTIQRIGESKDSLMRAPDTRIFKRPEFIHNIDSLMEKINLE